VTRSKLFLTAALAGMPNAALAQTYRALPLDAGSRPVILPAAPDSVEPLEWTTIDSGGGRLSGGGFVVDGTAGQFDTAVMGGDAFELESGFWAPIEAPGCYANCDESTQSPALNIADFSCFLQKFSAGDSYANCDHSTTPPVLNISDFSCFLQKFAGGCN